MHEAHQSVWTVISTQSTSCKADVQVSARGSQQRSPVGEGNSTTSHDSIKWLSGVGKNGMKAKGCMPFSTFANVFGLYGRRREEALAPYQSD